MLKTDNLDDYLIIFIVCKTKHVSAIEAKLFISLNTISFSYLNYKSSLKIEKLQKPFEMFLFYLVYTLILELFKGRGIVVIINENVIF